MKTQQTVLITGASSGIGMELAREFAKHGHALVLVARGVDKLEELARDLRSKSNVRAEVIGADLTEPSAPEKIVKSLGERNLTIDVLVNNAGFGERGAFAQIDMQRQLDMIQVNITAVAHLTRLLLPGMIQRNAGGVLNVASTAAFQGGPNMAMYGSVAKFKTSRAESAVVNLFKSPRNRTAVLDVIVQRPSIDLCGSCASVQSQPA